MTRSAPTLSALPAFACRTPCNVIFISRANSQQEVRKNMTQMTMASPQMKMSDHHRSTSALFTVYHGLVRHIPLLITSSNPGGSGHLQALLWLLMHLEKALVPNFHLLSNIWFKKQQKPTEWAYDDIRDKQVRSSAPF